MQYVFGGYVLDTKRRMLDGPAGAVTLRPKVFALLELLVAERERVVSKEELFERLWPGVYVGDATLNTCIKLARQAVGDSGELQATIRTLHGHGYRFVASAEESDGGFHISSLEQSVPEETRTTPPPIPPASSETVQRERKQVTVLDCAIHDAAELARSLGADAMDEVMERFAATAEQIVRRYGGTVAQWQGDGFVALFGAPRAFEDHAIRAVVAALELQEGSEIGTAMGLHTGPIVVSPAANDPTRVFTAIGDTTEAARKLRLAAPANTLVASPETCAILGDNVSISGEAVGEVGRIIAALAAPSVGRADASYHALSRFVGRDRELGLLNDRMEMAALGDGQIVGILGEPGIGKSRLVDEFTRSAAAAKVSIFRGQCLAYASNSPYLPVRDLVLGFCGAEGGEPGETLRAKVAALLAEAAIDAPEAHNLICEVLGLASSEERPKSLSPEEGRTRTQSLLCDLAAYVAARGPCVAIIDDIHWIDATSEAWLAGLVTRLPGMRMLLVVTARTGYQTPWLSLPGVSQIALARLRPEDSAALLDSIPVADGVGEHGVKRIIDRAQGNPFFLEELTRNAAATADGETWVPETVQAVLAARIDQLAPGDKRLLQIAAAIGAEVPVALLRRVDDLNEPERQAALERLQAAEFLHERGTAQERRFVFKHALTQDVAYLGLVERTREAIHRRVAAALEAEFPVLARERPELLAHHLTESGDAERAVLCWRQAGRRASERSSEREAIAHFETALSLAEDLPDAASSARERLVLLLDLGVALQNVGGQGATEVGRAYQQANDLAAEIGDVRLSFEALWGLWTHRLNRCEFRSAKEFADRLLAIAQGIGERETLLQARHAVWTTARFRGDLVEALDQSARGIDLYDDTSSPPSFYPFGGHDPYVCALGARAIVLWLSGRADQSAKELADALAMAERLDHPATMANALVNAADLLLMQRRADALEAVARQLLRLAAKYDFDQPRAVGEFALGWCRCQDGNTGCGLAMMEEGLAAMRNLGRTYQELYHVALLAEAAVADGQAEPALNRLGRLLDGFAEADIRHWAEGEAYRINGEAMLAVGGEPVTAEGLMRKAISICRSQGALALELRAANSLSRLMKDDGRVAEAEALVDATRARFAESPKAADFALGSTQTDRNGGAAAL